MADKDSSRPIPDRWMLVVKEQKDGSSLSVIEHLNVLCLSIFDLYDFGTRNLIHINPFNQVFYMH